jgi:hypothetical protein
MKKPWLVLLLAACGPDLPEGWEDAERVHDLEQADCAGNPYEEHDEHIEVDFDRDPVRVDYLEAHFRCAQDVEAFARSDGADLSLLVQPIDMDPKVVAGCDCLFDIRMDVAEHEGTPDVVTLWRRWDNLNDPNPLVEIGTVAR